MSGIKKPTLRELWGSAPDARHADDATPTTAEATEREAREAVARKMVNFESPASSEWVTHNELLDTYAAAVRARALADVAGWVEGMRVSPLDGWSWAIGHNAAIDALLAKLREAK